MRKLFIILAAVAFVVAYTVPALANDWAFYGTVRIDTYQESTSKEANDGVFDVDEFHHEFAAGRLGANVTSDYGIGGKFEYSESVGTRYFYGFWDFGGGKLVVGQDESLLNFGCAECNIRGGSISDGLFLSRSPQVALHMGNFKVALIENAATNKSDNLWDPAGYIASGDPDDFDDVDFATEVGMPKIEAEYALNLGPLALEIGAGYNTFERLDQDAATETECSYDVDSWVVALGAAYAMGPATIKVAASQSQNGANYGLDKAEELFPVYWDEKVYDVDRLGWQVSLGYKMSDTISVGVGYGQSEQELKIEDVKIEDTMSTYYVVATIMLSKGIRIQPEYSFIDYDEIKADGETFQQGDTSYLGLRWRVDF